MAEYDINEDLTALVGEVVNKEYAETLVEHQIRIVACTKVKLDKETQEPKIAQSPPVKITKIGPLYNLYIPADYILVMDYAFMKEANDVQQRAAISKALCSIKVEVTEDGRKKLSKRQYDIQTFAEYVRVHGLEGESEPVKEVLRLSDALMAGSKTTAKAVTAKKVTPKPEPAPEPPESEAGTAPEGEEHPPEEEERPRVVSRMPEPAPARVAPPTLKPKVQAKPRNAPKPEPPADETNLEPVEELPVTDGLPEENNGEAPVLEPVEEEAEPMPPPRRGVRPGSGKRP